MRKIAAGLAFCLVAISSCAQEGPKSDIDLYERAMAQAAPVVYTPQQRDKIRDLRHRIRELRAQFEDINAIRLAQNEELLAAERRLLTIQDPVRQTRAKFEVAAIRRKLESAAEAHDRLVGYLQILERAFPDDQVVAMRD